MTSARRSGIADLRRATATLGLIACAAAVLLHYPPAQNAFYPQCPVFALLHLQCPGCGATRALAALFHGRLREALHCNALFTLSLPVAFAHAALCGRRQPGVTPFHWPRVSPMAIRAGLATAVVFTILRNLPLRLW